MINIFKAVKYLLRDISPVRVTSATADVGKVDKEYKPQEVALDIKEAQQKAYKQLLVQVVELVHKTSINAISAKVFLDNPTFATMVNNKPNNEELQETFSQYLKQANLLPDELAKKILTVIYEEFPELSEISNKVFNG